MRATLIEQSERGTRSHALPEATVRIGRGVKNNIALVGPNVSEDHVEIIWTGEAYLVRDLGSKNGTLLNGERLSPTRVASNPHPLRDGDELVLPSVSLVFRHADDTATFTLAQPSKSGLVVDHDRAEVRLDGRLVELSPKAYEAIAVLDKRRGKLLDRDEFARLVWPEHNGITTEDSIDNIVKQLRQKLGDDSRNPRYLRTVPKRGLILER